MILHWFRRDLRLHDNTALAAACHDSGGRVVPVFILSHWRGQHRWTGPARQSVLCGTLCALSEALEKCGSRLILRRGDAVAELERLLTETGAEALYYNCSPDPAGRALETRVHAMARKLGVRVQGFHDVTALAPDAVLTQGGEPFRVFTPFSRAWLKKAAPGPDVRPLRLAPAPAKLQSLPLPTLADWGLDPAHLLLPDSGEPAALRRMDAFFSGPAFRYAAERDLPAVHATSRLSADLRFGALSPRLLVQRCHAAIASAQSAAQRDGPRKFLSELIWREFYMAILWHWPEVLEHEFQPRFRGMRWQQPGQAFQRWQEGTTGFPIIDAGMRQLAATGWMHNRVRMIVAMFLTKDLHLDWRLGEAFFMQHLADGEIASNNGGWQWSAGTGADAAPYFRIQNPWTQSARFDPEGDYIKQWVPELRNTPARALMQPPASGKGVAPGYPAPLLDHARERETALALYQRVFT
ncbi:MAG: deoxyribodipyrimidine photo-lyase [Verrucomicrobia bacterium]|nr:deoxyribodipyrimidine photo-lyase [Verrucomicrobiota bacterium]